MGLLGNWLEVRTFSNKVVSGSRLIRKKIVAISLLRLPKFVYLVFNLRNCKLYLHKLIEMKLQQGARTFQPLYNNCYDFISQYKVSQF